MSSTPSPPAPGSITELIDRANGGDADALNRLFEDLYPELHSLARARIRRNSPITMLDTTSLLHEFYLRLTKVGTLNAASRARFMGYAARAMRNIITDFARARLAERRGGGASDVTLDTGIAQSAASTGEKEVLRVHEALEELAAVDERMVRVVEMRYFGGLTDDEIAEALGLSARTVQRDWEKARLLLSIALR